ncbi:hypothetical protein KGQ20_13655 [Catenulispora sp. NF23]|uniref:hypothetical protein n=1 Tax=Catenulispora pinistramenti TaxID=2705254 RepID=UPI001BAD7F95|nr:hypothetical protein [Catenulispora pinistramenti]MBS2533813.1 hypothetical protein [Catenulispora pinistramenti]
MLCAADRPGVAYRGGRGVAIAPAVVCGWPDGIFGSPEHLAFVASVVAVTAVAVVAATIITVRRPI